MRIFDNSSLKNKLRVIILLTSGIVLFLASVAFVTNDTLTFRRNMVTDVFVLAELVGINSTAGLLFKDNFAVEENMQALKANKHIVFAKIFNKKHQLFVTYFKQDVDKTSLPNVPILTERQTIKNNYIFNFSQDYVDIFRKIYTNKQKFVGTVYIRSDLEAFYQHLFWAGSIITIIIILSLLLALILAFKFQTVLTAPIDSLLATMKAVSKFKDYSLSAKKINNDELGKLVDSFNDMLAQIKNHETELAKARDQAMAANQAKSAFLANMSHELRTPLNGILGYAQILIKDRTLNEQQKTGISIIQRSGDYLLTLISDILDLSKIEAGKLEIFPAEFHLKPFLNSLAELFKMRAQQKDIEFIYKFSDNLPIGVSGDEKRLRQIVINLLGNAIKFTKQGQVSFSVEFYDNKFIFKIIDSGIGIAKEELKNIFLPFQQAGDKNSKEQGTGLGLSITKKLIDRMGGKLHVDSILGQGSTFWVELELPIISTMVEEPKSINIPQVIGYKNSETPLQILVVDDNWENRAILQNLLEPLSFKIITAVDGIEGVKLAAEHQPDLILMDLVMPEMDGFDATREIRKITALKDIPIIAASASVFEEHHQLSLDVGCNEFLDKPIRESELLDVLKRFLNVEWIYETLQENNIEVTEEQPLVMLSTEQATTLTALAKSGNIKGIINFAKQLDSELTPMAKKITDLAKGFDINGLRFLAQEMLEK
ncbi:ATP-binding protein [Candidatus Marithrix sp. Canyon 246]|uniref:ATP-binding protein n=1 Tax=Candidatus Marithrix sp. Canyon 246 TaxID=1827136 RepID=UPI00084A1AA9|nr:ATP-binding protein [Candidatus Marithrix sp. Canyon 246]